MGKLGEGPRRPGPPSYFGCKKKKSLKKENPAGQVKENQPPSLAQTLDLQLTSDVTILKLHLAVRL